MASWRRGEVRSTFRFLSVLRSVCDDPVVINDAHLRTLSKILLREAWAVVHRELETHDTGSISTVHIRVWSPAQKKLARVDLPFWLMRLGGNKPFTVSAGSMSEVQLHVTPEEIDRRGPGLIVLWTTSRDSRLLVWTE